MSRETNNVIADAISDQAAAYFRDHGDIPDGMLHCMPLVAARTLDEHDVPESMRESVSALLETWRERYNIDKRTGDD